MLRCIRLLSLVLVSLPALAEEASVPASPSMSGQLIMLGGFFVIFYFLVWRPQSKRAKAHQSLIQGLKAGDEVVVSGGVLGKIAKISDHFVTLMVAEGVEIKVQRQAVVALMPKGTIQSA